MVINMYSIFDTLSEIFHKPFTEINNASATRAFNESIKENPNKNDFVLYHIGAYDDNSGTIIANSNPVKVTSGIECKTAEVTELPTHLTTQSGI